MSVAINIGPPERPAVAVIAGATATGKSEAALALAEAVGGVIINADASQLYADLRVLTARPTDADLGRAPHRLYGILDAAQASSAAEWAMLARAEIDTAVDAGRLPIVVGGSGLYLRALLDGLAAVPPVDAGIRAAVRALDPSAARAALAAEDPHAAARLHPGDRQRTLRALEVVRATGRPLADWRTARDGGLAASHRVVAAICTLDRAVLRERCATRVDTMLAAGAVAEVTALLARRLPADRPILRAIGVPPLADHLAGRSDLAAARERIVHDTRRYAKRQTTWWRNQCPGWPSADAADVVERLAAAVRNRT